MAEQEEENVNEPLRRCWNCGWVVLESQLQSMFAHSCFASYNEQKHVIVINEDGVISMSSLTSKKKKFVEDVKLINAVSERPILFDKDLKLKASSIQKDDLWTEVAKKISPGYSAEVAKKRWKCLRDQYTRSLFNEDCSVSRHFERMHFFHKNVNKEQPVLREPSQNVQVPSLSVSPKSINTTKRAAELDISERAEKRRSSANIDVRTSDDSLLNHSEEGSLQSENTPSTSSATRLAANAKERKRSGKDAASIRKEELQMLILQKIRDHKVERTEPTDLFLLSLAETFKTLEHWRQLRVHRRYIEILEQEYNEQEYDRSMRDTS